MAQVVSGNQIRLNDGRTIQAEQGGWYDGQQFWGGTLSQPGQINSQSNQIGAGQPVSQEVIAQTNPANVSYINAERQRAGLTPAPSVYNPTPQPSSRTPATTGASGSGVGFTAPETINLPKLYESLYVSSGIRDIESELMSKTNAYNTQVAKIKDNPYLSEATMTGRIKKIEEKFSADTQAIKNDIAMRKADIETKLNLETKQFDINSQQTQLAWQQFNTLLNSGALDNASGEDIANITRSTGISSSMIQSAIDASKKSKEKPVNTQVIQSTNDAGVVTVSVINADTGEIINQQSLGSVGNVQNGAKEKEPNDEQAVGQIIRSYLGDKSRQAQISPEDLYRELLLQYPGSRVYLEANFTPQQIRSILGN
jgi:hypothetical protein